MSEVLKKVVFSTSRLPYNGGVDTINISSDTNSLDMHDGDIVQFKTGMKKIIGEPVLIEERESEYSGKTMYEFEITVDDIFDLSHSERRVDIKRIPIVGHIIGMTETAECTVPTDKAQIFSSYNDAYISSVFRHENIVTTPITTNVKFIDTLLLEVSRNEYNSICKYGLDEFRISGNIYELDGFDITHIGKKDVCGFTIYLVRVKHITSKTNDGEM